MKPHHHLDAATLMSYSAGAMPAAFAAVVSAHLSVCKVCRDHLLDADGNGNRTVLEAAFVAVRDGPIREQRRHALLDGGQDGVDPLHVEEGLLLSSERGAW